MYTQCMCMQQHCARGTEQLRPTFFCFLQFSHVIHGKTPNATQLIRYIYAIWYNIMRATIYRVCTAWFIMWMWKLIYQTACVCVCWLFAFALLTSPKRLFRHIHTHSHSLHSLIHSFIHSHRAWSAAYTSQRVPFFASPFIFSASISFYSYRYIRAITEW